MNALKNIFLPLVAAFFAAFALAGCGALFDSPDSSGVASPGTGTPPPVMVMGCINPAATNYNPLATADDGSCVLPLRDETPLGADFLADTFVDAPQRITSSSIGSSRRILKPNGTNTFGVNFAPTETDASITSNSGFFVGGGRLDFADDDEYLIFGVWERLDDIGGFAIGAIFSDLPSLPTGGTATYLGGAKLWRVGRASGNRYDAAASFTVDFSTTNPTLSGRLTESSATSKWTLLFDGGVWGGGRFSGRAITCGAGGGCVNPSSSNWQATFFGAADTAKNNAPNKIGGSFIAADLSLEGQPAANVAGSFGARLQ